MLELTRRELISSAIAAAGLMATSPISSAAAPKKPIVYWTPELSGDALLRLYQLINKDITGRVALKLHTGEPGGPNILPREWIKQFQRRTAKHDCRVQCSLQEPASDKRRPSSCSRAKRLELLSGRHLG